MKRALSLLVVALPIVPIAGCSSSEDGPTYPSGGTGPIAGSSTTGGSSSTAGSDQGGSTTTAGTTGDSGSTSTSGSSSGGSTGASGSGSGGSGMGGSSGSGMGGSGGSAMAGSGGSMAGSGGGGADVSLGKLDGFLLQTPCKAGTNDDCDSNGWVYEGMTHACVGNAMDTDAAATKTILDFPVTGGVAGKVYLAKMHFYGIMEPKVYGDSIMREATARPGQDNPSNPAPFAWSKTPGATYPSSDYNTYEIHVIDDKGMAYKDYYLNADTQSGHWTFPIDYERDLEVVGGGKIHIRSFDQNCRMIKNCGPSGHQTGATACAGQARTIAGVSAAMPAINVMQPGLGVEANSSGQWFAIDVKTIVPKP
jgi:hypothetical protein